MTDKTTEKLAETDTRREKIIQLTRDLEKSLELQKLWPEAFTGEKLPATSQVTGSEHKTLYFTITNSKGDSRVFELQDVPEMLWPDTLPDRIRRKLRRLREATLRRNNS